LEEREARIYTPDLEMQIDRQTWRTLRWAIVAALFVISVINYLDRQSLSLLAPAIQKQLSLNDESYAHIVAAFMVAYTISYLIAGRITDWLGAGKSLLLFVVWWSLAEMLPPFARGARSLALARFTLGLGEGGNYVAAPKAIGQWFEPEERAMAIGIYTAGATIGATLAPILVATLSSRFGWPVVFFATGVAGLLWILPWIYLYRRMDRLTAARSKSADVHELSTEASTEDAVSENIWGQILRKRTTWYLLVARFLTDPVWYFYLFWYPKYMVQVRHLTVARVGYIIWAVYLAADIGTLIGGYLSGRLIRKGRRPLPARRTVMTFAACVMPVGILVPLLPSITQAVSVAGVIAFAHMAWLVTLTALLVDQYPSGQIGTAMGLVAAGSGLGGILSTELIGWAVTTSGYTPVFCVISLLHIVALLFLWKIREPRGLTDSANLPGPTLAVAL
jgi:ACS family hexuronate transporter-like MFS transporter